MYPHPSWQHSQLRLHLHEVQRVIAVLLQPLEHASPCGPPAADEGQESLTKLDHVYTCLA
jgi:hypothetical protein